MGGNGTEIVVKIECSADESCMLFGFGKGDSDIMWDFYAAKLLLKPEMKLAWAKSYGGTHHDKIWTAIATSDGGYLMLGSTSSMFFTATKVFLTGYDQDRPLVIKIDSIGNVQWAKTIGPLSGFPGFIHGVTELEDSYLFAGTQDFGSNNTVAYDVITFKLSKSGDFISAERYDSGIHEGSESILQTSNGKFLIPGFVNQNEKEEPFLMEIGKNGHPIWAKKYSTSSEQSKSNCAFYGISGNPNGNFFLSGRIEGSSGTNDRFLAFVTPEGRLIWSNQYTRNREEMLYHLIFPVENDVVLLGRSLTKEDVERNRPAGVMLRIDNQGSIKDSLIIENDKYNEFTAVERLSSGHYFLLGHTSGFGAITPDVFMFLWNSSTKQPEKPQFEKIPVELQDQMLDMKRLSAEISLYDVTKELKVRNLTVTTKFNLK